MLDGMYTAAAGMAAQQQRMDAVANDLANASTTGYKSVRVAFRDLVYNEAGAGTAAGVLVGAGAAATVIGRSQEQGALQATGRPLDIALQGPGYLAVRLADGRNALTRDGGLTLDAEGRLRLAAGHLVDPEIRVPAGTDADDIKIMSDGEVRAGERAVGRLRIVTVPAPSGLQGGPDNTFLPTAASGAARPAGAGTQVTQGSLEGSNVDMAQAFAAMIEAQRTFAMASRAIQNQDRLLEIANGVKR